MYSASRRTWRRATRAAPADRRSAGNADVEDDAVGVERRAGAALGDRRADVQGDPPVSAHVKVEWADEVVAFTLVGRDGRDGGAVSVIGHFRHGLDRQAVDGLTRLVADLELPGVGAPDPRARRALRVGGAWSVVEQSDIELALVGALEQAWRVRRRARFLGAVDELGPEIR